jgi:hypothetical protein
MLLHRTYDDWDAAPTDAAPGDIAFKVDHWGEPRIAGQGDEVTHYTVDGETDDGLVGIGPGAFLLRRWRLRVDAPDLSPLEVIVELDHDRQPRPRRVLLETRAGEPQVRMALDDERLVRHVRRALTLARVTAAELDQQQAAAPVEVAGRSGDPYAAWRGARPTLPRGTPLPDAFVRDVAEVYRTALQLGDPPTQTVADVKGGAPRPTAAAWVREARKRGHLAEATPGRAGG